MKRFAIVFAAVLAGLATLVGGAQAQTPFGQLAPGAATAECKEQFDLVQLAHKLGATYEVPDNGVITSWSTNARAGAGQMLTFKVFRGGPDQYTVVAHDGPRPLTPGVINTFKVAIPVKAGDIIGLNTANASPAIPNACSFEPAETSESEDIEKGFLGDGPDGGTISNPFTNTERRVNVAATVLQPPEINIFGRVSLGSIAGGAHVRLEGAHFEEVTAVTIGGVPAKSFNVLDEHHIDAVAPAGKTLAEIPVAVTTVAGTVTAPPRFSYSGCLVPKLVGKTLAVAKRKLKAAGCKLGRVKRARGRKGRVLKQRPKAGKVLVPGSKVKISVGR